MATLKFKTLNVHVAGSDSKFDVALYEGASADSLVQAVAARAGVAADAMFFTVTPDPAGTVVPLSSALPDGLTLTLHFANAGDASTPKPTAPTAGSPMEPRPGMRRVTSRSRGVRNPEIELNAPLLSGGEAPAKKAESTSFSVSGSRCDLSDNEGTTPEAGQTFPANDATEGNTYDNARASPFARLSRRPTLSVLMGQQEATAQLVDHVERFSRLSTDLANERTLLAWIRTCLAALRTVFAFYAMEGIGEFWNWSVTGSQIMMAVLVVVLAVTGECRYKSIRQALMVKDPPTTFGRVSLRYTYSIVVLSSIVTCAGVTLRRWQK
mmetsp:Transcript_22841/g.63851  ORF Transcript_22841/g.63851 Transcript_22841/m.63851 type:complete len:324 (-) Transcript_22841:174-1145(-)